MHYYDWCVKHIPLVMTLVIYFYNNVCFVEMKITSYSHLLFKHFEYMIVSLK